jgi:GAF domain-containing protein
MIKAPTLKNEKRRLDVLAMTDLANSKSDPRFDEITKKAVDFFKVPISTVSIIDDNTEHYKSCIGIEELSGPREISFCGHALAETDILVCNDTLEDERFKDNPYVINKPFIRFYAGMRLFNKKHDVPLGVFCIKDIKPRSFSVEEIAKFIELSQEAEAVLNKY